MIDTILAYLTYFIFFGIIATAIGWIVVGMNSTISALCLGFGIAGIAVGALGVLNELRNRTL